MATLLALCVHFPRGVSEFFHEVEVKEKKIQSPTKPSKATYNR